VNDIITAIVLGILEGLTEFIPVSSTGHLLLAKLAMGVNDSAAWDSFVILIQLGAILALVAVYFARLFRIVLALPFDPLARRFALSILLAFLPAVVIGVLVYDFVKLVLFETPRVVCIALILGGFGLLALDRWAPAPRHDEAMRLPLLTSLGIGLMQCVAMIPGVSRSGATIAGGVLLRVNKRAAAEFSFFLSIPTMVAAFTKEVWESRETLAAQGNLALVALGLAASFITGLLVVKFLLNFVARHGLAPFGWWRIGVGTLGLILLSGVV
jgi:undecaprenyl-diphosphatase